MAEQDTNSPNSIGDVVDGIEELADDNSEVTFDDVLQKFGSRSFAPVMLVLSLTELSPVGTIPGVPSALALCIMIVAVQMLLGRGHIWMPGFIKNRSVSGDKLSGATEKLDGIAGKLDKISGSRLEFLTRGPAIQAAALVIILLCICVPPLEMLPWAAAGPMLAIAIISLALLVRDGLAMLIAWLLAAGAVGGASYYFITTGVSLSDFNPF